MVRVEFLDLVRCERFVIMSKETAGYVNSSKVIPSSYPNEISIIEGIIRISSFTDDLSDCYTKEKLTNFIIGYFDPNIECNILRDENGKVKLKLFNCFEALMIAAYDCDKSYMNVVDKDDEIYVFFRLKFDCENGDSLNIPIDWLEDFVKIENGSCVHLYSKNNEGVTLDEVRNYE